MATKTQTFPIKKCITSNNIIQHPHKIHSYESDDTPTQCFYCNPVERFSEILVGGYMFSFTWSISSFISTYEIAKSFNSMATNTDISNLKIHKIQQYNSASTYNTL